MELENIIELWEWQVQRSKNDVVLHYEGKEYTYGQIDCMANAIAAEVASKKSSSLVGIMMNGSAEYVISVLGILKSGRGFVPIDKNIPVKRRDHMIQDCCLDTIIVLNRDNVSTDSELNYIVFEEKEISENPILELKTKIAYVIYTSGTTGIPKGIMVGHSSVINMVKWFDQTYDIKKNKNIIQMSSVSFDVSVEEIFGCILNEGTLFIPKESIKIHKTKIRNYIKKNEVNIVQVVPILLDEIFSNDEKIDSINVLICGGEELNNELKDKVLLKGYHLYNHYGPTETTVDATRSVCELGKGVVLGRPINNSECYVLSEEGKIFKNNAIGELCISGDNLAIGYLNDVTLTNKKFLELEGVRIYKTGDKVHINEVGDIEFLGRIDEQVKLNGRRIELEEINHYFSKLFKVSLCKTILIKDEIGEKIVTFYMGDNEYKYEEVLCLMKEYLPEFMIPVKIIKYNYFDRDGNGKVSKHKLIEKYEEEQEKIKKDNSVSNQEGKNTDVFLKSVLEITSEILLLEIEELRADISLNELSIDSLIFIQMVVELEMRFDIEFEDDKLALSNFHSLQELSQYVKGIVNQ